MPPLVFWGAIFFHPGPSVLLRRNLECFFAKQLKNWHLGLFFLGVLTDCLGTHFMYLHVGHLIFTAHSIAGFLGLFLMVFHCGWAFFVLKNNDTQRQATFHRFSILVWLFWLVSYFSGLYLGLSGI